MTDPADRTMLRPRTTATPALTVPGTPAVIGRGREADVTVDDDSVSDRHARLDHRDGRWWITDLGSTNGTRVDGTRLEPEEPHPLDNGSEIRLGGFVATLEEGRAVVEANPPVETVAPVRRGAFRVPVWAVLLLLLVIALLAILVFTMTGDPETVSTLDPGARILLEAPWSAPPVAPAA